MKLNDAPLGVTLTITSLTADDHPRRQFIAHGIWPGARVEVFHKAAFGGRVVRLGTDRIALDKRACSHVEVEQAPEADAA